MITNHRWLSFGPKLWSRCRDMSKQQWFSDYCFRTRRSCKTDLKYFHTICTSISQLKLEKDRNWKNVLMPPWQFRISPVRGLKSKNLCAQHSMMGKNRLVTVYLNDHIQVLSTDYQAKIKHLVQHYKQHPHDSTAQKLSFEWSHFRIWSPSQNITRLN